MDQWKMHLLDVNIFVFVLICDGMFNEFNESSTRIYHIEYLITGAIQQYKKQQIRIIVLYNMCLASAERISQM